MIRRLNSTALMMKERLGEAYQRLKYCCAIYTSLWSYISTESDDSALSNKICDMVLVFIDSSSVYYLTFPLTNLNLEYCGLLDT